MFKKLIKFGRSKEKEPVTEHAPEPEPKEPLLPKDILKGLEFGNRADYWVNQMPSSRDTEFVGMSLEWLAQDQRSFLNRSLSRQMIGGIR